MQLEPIDFMTHIEFNPYHFMIVWFSGRELEVSEYITIRGKNKNVINFVRCNLV